MFFTRPDTNSSSRLARKKHLLGRDAVAHGQRHGTHLPVFTVFVLAVCHRPDHRCSMSHDKQIRTGRHCVFDLHAPLVFVTKYRQGVFTSEILADLQAVFASVCQGFESTLVKFDGEDDHVHLLVWYPPKVALSHLVNSLKGCRAG